MESSLVGKDSLSQGGDLQVAIAGDLHDQWDRSDEDLLLALAPDGFLVVGDLSNGMGRIPRSLARLPLPLALSLIHI